MAGIDYTIPQQFKGIQVESPINAMAQAMQLRNLQESSEMNALRRREYQRAREEEEAVRNWFASGKKLDSPEALNELYARAPSAAANIEKSMLERSRAAAEIGYKKAQTAGEDIKTQRERLDFTERALYKSTTPAAAIGHINQAVTLGYLTPDAAERMKASVPNDPNQFQSWRMNLLTHSLSAKDLLDRLESQQDLAYAAAVTKAVETYAPIPSREEFFGSQQKVAPTVAPTAAPTVAPTSSVSATTQVPTPNTTVVTRSADVAAPVTAPSIDAAPQPNIEPIVWGESFVDYKNKAILNNRGHIPDQDTYFAEQDRLARQASAVAAKTTAAPTTTTTTQPPAPGEERALDTVELISGFKGIDPQAADLYKLALTVKNPDARAQLNKIADEIQKRSQLTGEFFNVDRAEQIITELEKNKTPENVRRIAALRGAINAQHLGKAMPAPTITMVLDPNDPTRMLSIDARRYQGGSVGSQGVIGVAGKEPTGAKKEEAKETARENASTTIAQLRQSYDRLDKLGGITSTTNLPGTNIAAGISSSGAGQAVGRFFGTEAQSERNKIAQTRPLLMTTIMSALGLSAKQLDSNAELKLWLSAATDPTLDLEANRSALDNLERILTQKGKPAPKLPAAKSDVRSKADAILGK